MRSRRHVVPAWAIAGALAGAAGAGQGVPCWHGNAALEERCCSNEGLIPKESCFDKVFTPLECCDGCVDGLDRARTSVDAEPEPFVEGDLGFHGDGFDVSRHPAFSEKQRLFEDQHYQASSTGAFTFSHDAGRKTHIAQINFFKESLDAVQAMFDDYQAQVQELFDGSKFPDGADGVVVEVGAGLGMFAIVLALRFPSLLFVVVEPSPENFRYLLWNVRENGLADRIWPLNVALRMPTQPAVLFVQHEAQRPTPSKVCERSEECGVTPRSVAAVTVAELFRRLRLRRVRWTKMDCADCVWRASEDPMLLPLLREVVEHVTVDLRAPPPSMGEEERDSVIATWCLRPEERGRAVAALRSGDAAVLPAKLAACTLKPCLLPGPSMGVSGDGLVADGIEGDGPSDARPELNPFVCGRPPYSSHTWRWRGAWAPEPGEAAQWPHKKRGPQASACGVGFVDASSAEAHCRRRGARRCTAEELQNCMAAERWMCGWDDEFVWSSDECDGGHIAVRAGAHCGLEPTPAMACLRFAYGGRCCDDNSSSAATWTSRIFLLSSLSHDDRDQWPLIPHWVSHYRDTLGLRTDRFLIILHSDSGNLTGVERMGRRLNEEFGVRHVFPDVDPYHAKRHLGVKYAILHRYVFWLDWVIQADADEFVYFPEARLARDALSLLDEMGGNFHFCMMVDRVADGGDLDVTPQGNSSIFGQFPINCALTTLLQKSDARKICAYRGYLRTTAGNHNIVGANGTFGRSKIKALRALIRQGLGDRVFSTLPYDYREGKIPELHGHFRFGTAYHFKWIRGLAHKLRRRASTAPETLDQYLDVHFTLHLGGARVPDMSRYCMKEQPFGTDETPRAMTSRELVKLFLAVSDEKIEAYVRRSGIRGAGRVWMWDNFAFQFHTAMAHETPWPED